MIETFVYGMFEWDEAKELENIRKHGMDFKQASRAFLDTDRIIAEDTVHSRTEPRLFCIGLVDSKLITVRFTYRNQTIRIIGAGFWRKGTRLYEKEQKGR